MEEVDIVAGAAAGKGPEPSGTALGMAGRRAGAGDTPELGTAVAVAVGGDTGVDDGPPADVVGRPLSVVVGCKEYPPRALVGQVQKKVREQMPFLRRRLPLRRS